jgi:hypothetical protein
MTDMDLYDANKGLLKRTGGPYLDEIEATKAEERRAVVEGREPDLENPPATIGTVLVPKHYLREADAVNSHVFAAAELENAPVMTVAVDTFSAFDAPADPKQVDWDNDSQKILAKQAVADFGDSPAPKDEHDGLFDEPK